MTTENTQGVAGRRSSTLGLDTMPVGPPVAAASEGNQEILAAGDLCSAAAENHLNAAA
jgi:hypothetical protein